MPKELSHYSVKIGDYDMDGAEHHLVMTECKNEVELGGVFEKALCSALQEAKTAVGSFPYQ